MPTLNHANSGVVYLGRPHFLAIDFQRESHYGGLQSHDEVDFEFVTIIK